MTAPPTFSALARFLLLMASLAITSWAQTAPPPDPPPASDAPADDDAVQTMFPHFKEGRFWISGQANFIFQTNPPFYAKYSGPNSFQPYYEKATSRVLTLYTGFEITKSIEVLADVEEAGGAGLSEALGLAGFTNLDVVQESVAEQGALPGAGDVPPGYRAERHED